jgi:hypothetical protein
MEFWKQCLSEESGKRSIKRVMLGVWFLVLVGKTLLSSLTLNDLYVFFALLSGKAVEEVGKYQQRK